MGPSGCSLCDVAVTDLEVHHILSLVEILTAEYWKISPPLSFVCTCVFGFSYLLVLNEGFSL